RTSLSSGMTTSSGSFTLPLMPLLLHEPYFRRDALSRFLSFQCPALFAPKSGFRQCHADLPPRFLRSTPPILLRKRRSRSLHPYYMSRILWLMQTHQLGQHVVCHLIRAHCFPRIDLLLLWIHPYTSAPSSMLPTHCG